MKQNVAICLLTMLVLQHQAASSAEPDAPSPVFVTRIEQRDIVATQTFVGTIQPSKRSTIGSAVDGRVIELLVDEGDAVKAGQPLVQLLTDTIELELEAANAELKYRRELLAELKNGSLPEEIAQAKARLMAVDAQSRFAESRLKRATSLFQSDRAASQDELDLAISESEKLQQSFAEAKAAYDLVIQGPRKEKIAQAEAQVEIQNALVSQLEDRITKHTIVSRFDGYVTAKHTEVGSWVQQGDPIVDVVALKKVEAVAHVDGAQAQSISIGAAVKVRVAALGDREFLGTVASVVPQADLRARTFPVKVAINNTVEQSGPVLKSGMFAQVLLPTRPVSGALLVPKDAIVIDNKLPQPWVVVFRPTGEAEKVGLVEQVPVELGTASGNSIQVIGKLRVGEYVVTEGNERLRPGQRVVATKFFETAPAGDASHERENAQETQRANPTTERPQ